MLFDLSLIILCYYLKKNSYKTKVSRKSLLAEFYLLYYIILNKYMYPQAA